MKPKMELADCIICRKQFSRRASLGNPKQICDDPRCKKIRNLGHEKPVTFNSIPNTYSIPTRALPGSPRLSAVF